MKLKRSFSLILAMLMLVSITVGCSNAEWGFYNLSQETSKLEKYQVTGEMGVELDNIASMTGEDAEEIAKLKSILNQYSINFDSQVDIKASKLTFTYYFKDKTTGAQKEFMSLISDGNKMYAKVDGLVNFIKGFSDAEANEEIDEVFGNIEYISIGKEELKELLTQAYNSEQLAEQVTNVYFDLGSAIEQNKASQDAFKGLMEDVYNQYETGLVKGNENKYTLSITAEDAINVFASFLNYSIDNIDQLGVYLKKYVNNLSNYEKQLLTLYNLDINEDNFNKEIDKFVEDVKNNSEQYKAAINMMAASSQQPELKSILKENKIEYSLEKTKDNDYVVDMDGVINITNPQTKVNMVKGSFSFKETIKKLDSVSITVPTENITDLKEIIDRVEAIEQKNALQIDLDNGYYISGAGEGNVNVKVIKGSSYLPLRDVGKLLGEQISWDNQMKQPYVEIEGSRTYLTAVVLNGTSYIPSRAFENLGYKVSWDAATNVVTIK